MGSDLFTTKCEAHNYVVPYRSSCPICVSAKRSQLHAANLAHMPRYLFEQKLNTACDETGLHKPWQAKPLPCDVRWKVNFKSNHFAQTYSKLESTTQALIMALDVTTDSKVLTMRYEYQSQIDWDGKSPSEQTRILNNLAVDMYHESVRVTKSSYEDCSRITGQFVHHFKLLYGSGQRLVKIQPGEVPELVSTATPKYQLNFPSTYGAASLNNTTLVLLRKLDKYEGTLGKLRMDHQRTIACLDKQSTYYQMAVKTMALGLWNYVSAGEDREMSIKVRDQFLGQVEYLYGLGQRLTEVPAVQPPKAARYRDYADDVYDYILTGSNELYGRQRLLEANLDAKLAQYKLETRPYVISAFRDFARDACDFYIIDKMPNCNALTTGHVYTLQTILADAYLAGDRR